MMLLLCLFLASSMHSSKEEGKALGHAGKSQAFSQIEHFPTQELLPSDLKGKTFDSKQAQEQAKACATKEYVPDSSTVGYLRSKEVQHNKEAVSKDEYFLERSEHITENPEIKNLEIEEALEYHIETCQQTDAPFPLSVIRDLHVEVVLDPGESKDVRICLRHSYKKNFHSTREANKKVKELRDSLARDPTIGWFRVDDPKGGGALHRYKVEAHWEHREDAQTCDHYQSQHKQMRAPKLEEVGDTWVYEDKALQSLGNTPDCTLIQSECLDVTPSKTIQGKEVQRACWKEKLTFLCQLQNSQDCPYIKNQNCELIKKECLKQGPYGCSLWELTFKCYSKIIKKRVGESELYGLEEEIEYEPNDSFSEIAATLAVFDAIKKDLEESQAGDARVVQVFKGQKMQCSKSIADKIMYDCCFSYSGLAKDLGLKNCKSDEIALAEMRENGLCHYVGTYPETFCDLWKSRDEHVFCCFGSKLSRILQENARAQLRIGWNEPKHASCRGLSLDEIAHLDFTRMNFSELYADYEKKLPASFQSKLESLENKVKEKVKQHEAENV